MPIVRVGSKLISIIFQPVVTIELCDGTLTIKVVAIALANIILNWILTHYPVGILDINLHGLAGEVTTRLTHKVPCRDRILRRTITVKEVIYDLPILGKRMTRIVGHSESHTILLDT